MAQFARILGGLGTLYTAWTRYSFFRGHGQSMERAAIKTGLGLDIEDPTANRLKEDIIPRLVGTYWPAILGEAGHQILGNPKGAWDTGIGMKLNRYTPKGMNL